MAAWSASPAPDRLLHLPLKLEDGERDAVAGGVRSHLLFAHLEG